MLELEGFKLVYQGGHHNVYCDGKKHIKTSGGSVGHKVKLHPRWTYFKCDCQRWRAPEGNLCL
jgi:hypothetical protein